MNLPSPSLRNSKAASPASKKSKPNSPATSRQVANLGVEQAADDKFRLGILAANAGHQDAMSVCFENTILRSEPDVVLISSNALLDVPAQKNKIIEKADEVIAENFHGTGLVNFQCKTNWNDNAQVPMLWNMLYNQTRKGAVIPNGFSIGKNGFNLKNLGAFGYGFVTVPTQKKVQPVTNRMGLMS